jgi:mRNA interferase MazF
VTAQRIPLGLEFCFDVKTMDEPQLGRMNPDNQNRLMKVSAADTFQIRSVSKKRFSRKIGAVSSTILDEIKTAVKAVIDTD